MQFSKIFVRTIFIVCCALSFGSACAQAPELPFRFEKLVVRHVVNDNASHTTFYESTSKALTARGAEQLKRSSLVYSASVEKAKVIEAYTLKADGRRVDVPRDNYQTETAAGLDSGRPAFTDFARISVVFPDLEVGDATVFKTLTERAEPVFPNQLSLSGSFSYAMEYGEVSITVDAPLAMKTQVMHEQVNFSRTDKGSRQLLEWRFENPKAKVSERRNYSVIDLGQEPFYAFTTFANYGEIAQAYGARTRAQAVPTPRVRDLALSLVKDVTPGPNAVRDKTQRLYEWVAKNISYADHLVGLGAVVPREQAFVIDNKMGDCKDHTTLLQAMLTAVGIPSTQALVHVGPIYSLPRIPLSTVMNHVVTYVPELNLYLDSTSSDTPFGLVPQGLEDKPTLHVDQFSSTSKIPPSPVGAHQQSVKTKLIVGEDGSVDGEMQVQLKGHFAAEERSSFRGWPKESQVRFVKDALRRMQLKGDGSISFEDPTPLTSEFTWSVKFKAEGVFNIGGGIIPTTPFFNTRAPVLSFLGNALAPAVRENAVCRNGVTVEELEVVLPKTMTISYLPKDAEVNDSLLRFRATQRLDGTTLRVLRSLEDLTPAGVCPPRVANEYRASAAKALPSLRAQIVYQ
jgi:transglutaminase-like putative cysteine protease